MESLRRLPHDGNNRDDEEPKTKSPEEGTCGDGKEFHDPAIHSGFLAVVEEVELFWEALGHTNQGESCESGRADADEHTGAVFAVGEAGLHESSNVVRVHQEADGEAQSLEGNTGGDDGNGCTRRLVAGDDGRNGTTQHDREGRENPRGHHGLQAVGMGGEDEGVLDDGHQQGAGTVDPKEHLESFGEVLMGIGAEVLVQTTDDGSNREPEGWEEETFPVMTEGLEQTAM